MSFDVLDADRLGQHVSFYARRLFAHKMAPRPGQIWAPLARCGEIGLTLVLSGAF